MPRRGEYTMRIRVHNSVVQKYCFKCGKWRSLKDEFYTKKNNRVGAKPGTRLPRAYCKRCSNDMHLRRTVPHFPQHGLVAWGKIELYVLEAVRRIGRAEFCRRAEYSQQALWALTKGNRVRVHKVTAARLLTTAKAVIESGERRTREEIRYGNRRRVHEPSDGST